MGDLGHSSKPRRFCNHDAGTDDATTILAYEELQRYRPCASQILSGFFLRSLMYSLVNLRDSTHKYNMIKNELYQPENNLNFLFSGLPVTVKAKIKAYLH